MQIENSLAVETVPWSLLLRRIQVNSKNILLPFKKDLTSLQDDQDRDKIISWLSITDPSLNHYAACKKHQPITREWLIQQDEFEK